MTCVLLDACSVQHARLCAEALLVLSVVQPSVTSCDKQNDLFANLERQCLGDLPRDYAQGFGSERYGGGACPKLHDLDIRGIGAQKCLDRLQAHARSHEQLATSCDRGLTADANPQRFPVSLPRSMDFTIAPDLDALFGYVAA